MDIIAIGGAAHLLLNIGGEKVAILLEPGATHDRRSRRCRAITRVWKTYTIPDEAPVPAKLRGATVDIRHHTNDEDRGRKLNRTEVLRPIAEAHDEWSVVAQRNRAESMNQAIKHRWPDKRGPALGPQRKRIRLMFGAIGIAVTAAIRYEQRTGIDVMPPAQPPGTHLAAA